VSEEQTSKHRDTIGRDPNGPDPEDVWRIPVQVTRMESSFVVVRVRAGALKEAEDAALDTVRALCEDGSLEDHLGYGFDWQLDDYLVDGLTEVQGHVADYNVDIDKVKEEEKRDGQEGRT
jgi:hypothetical protein